MTTTAEALPVTRARDLAIDGLRGLAIWLMILDHVLVQAVPGHWLRHTLTRASLPLFALVAGYLWRPGWRWRYGSVFVASLPAAVLGSLVGIAQPDVLVVILVGYLLVWAVESFEPSRVAVVAVACVTLAIAETGWQWSYAGYDPRWVGGFMLLGRTVEVPRLGDRLARFELLTFAGRYPLSLYLGHLAVLAAVGWFLGFPNLRP